MHGIPEKRHTRKLTEKQVRSLAKKIAYKYSKDPDLREDIEGVCFYAVYRVEDKIDLDKNYMGYISRVMENRIKTFLMKKQPKVLPLLDIFEDNFSTNEFRRIEVDNIKEQLFSRISNKEKIIIEGLIDGMSILEMSKELDTKANSLTKYISYHQPRWQKLYLEIVDGE